MKITICGAMLHASSMLTVAKKLQVQGYEVETPIIAEDGAYGDNITVNADAKRDFINAHFAKIDTSDAILVVNEDKNGVANYIGGNTLIEIAYAYAQGLEVFLLNPIPDVSYADEVRGMHPIILDGKLEAIDSYMQSLPVLAASSESPVKHTALSRGLRRAGIRTRVIGVKVASGVNEQPISIEESYEGAINRHANLKTAIPQGNVSYLATIESGYHSVHKDHNAFGCSAIVIEKVNGEQKIGIDLDVEFPRSMTDKIPGQYPDIGVLVQQEYGSKLKDPYPYFTGGKLTRARVLENAVYNLAIQLA